MHVPDLKREKVESILHGQGHAQANRHCMCLKQGLRRAEFGSAWAKLSPA